MQHDDTLYMGFNVDLERHGFSRFIRARYPTITLVPVQTRTAGALDTVSRILGTIKEPGRRTVCLDGDTFYRCDILQMCRDFACPSGAVIVHPTHSPEPLFSYVQCDSQGYVSEIAEKDPISELACTGCYVFPSATQLGEIAAPILATPATTEHYMSDAVRDPSSAPRHPAPLW